MSDSQLLKNENAKIWKCGGPEHVLESWESRVPKRNASGRVCIVPDVCMRAYLS